jgi:hypothetical protein
MNLLAVTLTIIDQQIADHICDMGRKFNNTCELRSAYANASKKLLLYSIDVLKQLYRVFADWTPDFKGEVTMLKPLAEEKRW